jgi:tetratricopeptide (TPR) repeat protein
MVAAVAITGLRSPDLAHGSTPPGGALPTSAAAPAAQTASASSADEIATLEAVAGRVTVLRLGQPQSPTPSMPLRLNDIVVTREGRATVRFHSDGAVVRVGPDSRVQIDETAQQRDVTLFFGRLWAHLVRFKERPTRFKTSSTIAAIRGTEISLAVAVDGDETRLSVLEGSVVAETDAGSLPVEGGQTAVGRKGKAPALGVKVRPQDAVSWALYYLPVLSFKPEDLGVGPGEQAKVKESTEAYVKGDLARALESLEKLETKDIKDPRFFTYRASLLLATGSVQPAEKDIDQALRLAPNDSNALALQTVMAVVGNQADKAVETARRAVAAGPKSATPLVAQSYAQQAKFDLEGARESLEKAVTVEPDDALAWARLAEIRSSLGNRSESLEAAQKAVALEPNLSRTQTVLGYSYLTQVKTREAREAFAKAVELDKADPLPRLGLGLARIREGLLAEGTREIEIAVSLDPGQALVRSYLGKAYFEGKRAPLDAREYDVAKGLDPKDPTPLFYDSIAKQTTNQPVEALRELQDAIEANDNRGVYRSRLLLDQDLAARSASLGRIYSDLGFQDRALVEGWSSVNTDPSNYSAHRFLADSYAALPRHEIARVSELFQSQLLQPLNMTPIQPRLAESNLFLIGAGGPAALSFNEFNPLFSRDGVNFQATGLAGENGLWSGEGVLAGIYEKLSFSAGYNQFETDGWRANAFQEDKIANAFVQLELSPETSIQAEYRYRDGTHGDLQQRFFQDAFLPGMTNERQRDTFRVGGRHTFSPSSVLLASFTYQDSDIRTKVEFGGPEFFIENTVAQKSYGTELQHLHRSRYVNLTSGFGYFKIDGENQARLVIDGMVEELPTLPTNFDHVNAYAYANVKPATNVTLTAGASFDHLSGDLPGDGGDQFNPKLGVTWNPVPSTTVRGAVFRTLKRTLVTDQTLEPTQVGGFNQFYDDSDMTEGWRYGGAIDQKLGGDAYAGVEFSKRDLTVPVVDLESVTREAAWDESLARVYVFATPHPFLALRAQYIYERFEHEPFEGDDPLTFGFKEVKTHRVPLGVSFFHPKGVSASVTATYWNQDGEFEDLNAFPAEFRTGSSDFWLVDTAISFRLPKRYGFISVGVSNLFDKDFEYYEVDFDNPTIQPTRTFFAKLTLAVP